MHELLQKIRGAPNLKLGESHDFCLDFNDNHFYIWDSNGMGVNEGQRHLTMVKKKKRKEEQKDG